MCGIAAIMTRDPGKARAALRAMTDCQRHRGPDDDGHEWIEPGPGENGAGVVGLGQRRLAIIDLSPAGHQPMVHPETGDVITYNGELYNFQPLRRELEAAGVRFKGHSDTEVMLHALVRYGPGAVSRFMGMFAFAFFERKTGRMLVARDPLGIKPLYLARPDPRTLVLASEVRGVMASGLVPREIDPRAVAGVMAWGAVQEPCTIIKGVRSLPPGTMQWFEVGKNGEIREGPVEPHWQFPAPDPSMTEARAVESLRAALDESVRDHLISDVPVGVFLSSGLDSTCVAALASRHTPRLRTFTVGFADNPDMSEGELAGETARKLGVEHTDVQVLAKDALDACGRWMKSLDQPSMDGFNVYVISKAVREQGIIVALSGQGGDELFGGYPSFFDIPRARRTLRRLAWMPRAARGALLAVATSGKPEAVRLKAADMGRSAGSVLDLYLHRRRTMSDAQLAALGIEAGALGLDPTFLPPDAAADAPAAGGDTVATISRLESRFYMGNMLLHDGDTNGMAHSLEIRVPFLDRRVIDLAYTIPGDVMLPPGARGKHLIRRAFADHLRPAILEQGKKGFTLPINRWMTGPLRDLCESSLVTLKGSGLLRSAGIDSVWQSFLRAPETPIWSRAFTLCVLGTYLAK